jgi:leucyl aminopeptidase
MTTDIKVSFTKLSLPETGTLVLFAADGAVLGREIAALIGKDAHDALKKAAEAEDFKGKEKSVLVIPAPHGFQAQRLVLVGIGNEKQRVETKFINLGGVIAKNVSKGGKVTILMAGPEDWKLDGKAAADLALGIHLRSYKFDRYKSRKSDDDTPKKVSLNIKIASHYAEQAREAYIHAEAVAGGVTLARDLVNEPANVLTPEVFAKKAAALSKLGVAIEILDEKQLEKLGMRALLAVGQGSRQQSHVVIMRWHGVKGSKDKKSKPVAFIGKGVCFDTGGISIKPAANMEDMKGDMAGAACVVGLMHTLAARKARVDAVGIIGLVENMPDGNAQRPGDIVKSYDGQTIEVINTDAEGRLVLADLLAYTRDRFKPEFMINLATLTGAILVALGQEHAGLFSTDDGLSDRLTASGLATGEKVWRMPLGPAYDKMIDSRFADMKNSAGRYAGAITAAQFLRRYVGDVPWAHLDIAGTGMAAATTDLNQSWGPGWGVRLLDRLVSDHHE